MTPEAAYRSLWAQILGALPHLPDLASRLPGLPEAPPFQGAEPKPIAEKADLAAFRDRTRPAFLPLIEALIEVSPALRWHQSYRLEDGVSQAFLDDYGFIRVSGPDAPLEAHDHRLFIGFWGPGLHYPDHNHLPEEIYGTLAGEAVFHAEGRQARRVRPGDCIHHAPWQIHATDMDPGPYLALVAWFGEDLTVNPKIVKRP